MTKTILLIIFLSCAQFSYPSSGYFLPEKNYRPYKSPERYDHRIEDQTTEKTEFSRNISTKNSFKSVIQPKHIAAEEQRIKEENKSFKESKPNDFNEMQAPKEFLLEENQPKSIKNSLTFIEENYLTEETKAQEKKVSQEDKNIQNLFNPLTAQPNSINMRTAFEIPGEIFETFDKFINKMIINVLKNSKQISPHTKISQVSFSEIIAKSLQKYLFSFLRLPYKINTATNMGNALNNFRIEIQFLAEQIKNYNGKKYYTNPEQMLVLIKIINSFLKEADAQNIPREISIKFDKIYTQAAICCSLFQGKNIIFATQDTPTQILSFFQASIKNTNNLTGIQFNNNIMQTIYGKNGYTDQILQTWSTYQKSDLYRNKINREYGAFITFLLIFQNSIVAAANVLDTTSALYKVTNPLSLVININEN